jgi:arsenate reductase-like glutaredoxin family protein
MAPTIQIFGVKKCNDTNKAIRFFKERGVKTQFVDLTEKGLSKGELDSVSKCVPMEELIDREGKQFKKRNLEFMTYDLEHELLEDPLLFKTPIVRFGRKAAIGVNQDQWKSWAEEAK